MINKNKIVLCFFLLLSPFIAGCDSLYRVLDEKGAEEKEIVGEVVPYEINPTVEEIQTLLKLYGYNPGEIDGSLGVKTRNAIERFQKDLGLKTTRFADKETWTRLKIFKDKELIKDNDLNIVLIQQVLQRAGCNPGPIDGKRGARTDAAIKNFQKKVGIKVDGKVGYQTLTQMLPFLGESEYAEKMNAGF